MNRSNTKPVFPSLKLSQSADAVLTGRPLTSDDPSDSDDPHDHQAGGEDATRQHLKDDYDCKNVPLKKSPASRFIQSPVKSPRRTATATSGKERVRQRTTGAKNKVRDLIILFDNNKEKVAETTEDRSQTDKNVTTRQPSDESVGETNIPETYEDSKSDTSSRPLRNKQETDLIPVKQTTSAEIIQSLPAKILCCRKARIDSINVRLSLKRASKKELLSNFRANNVDSKSGRSGLNVSHSHRRPLSGSRQPTPVPESTTANDPISTRLCKKSLESNADKTRRPDKAFPGRNLSLTKVSSGSRLSLNLQSSDGTTELSRPISWQRTLGHTGSYTCIKQQSAPEIRQRWDRSPPKRGGSISSCCSPSIRDRRAKTTLRGTKGDENSTKSDEEVKESQESGENDDTVLTASFSEGQRSLLDPQTELLSNVVESSEPTLGDNNDDKGLLLQRHRMFWTSKSSYLYQTSSSILWLCAAVSLLISWIKRHLFCANLRRIPAKLIVHHENLPETPLTQFLIRYPASRILTIVAIGVLVLVSGCLALLTCDFCDAN